MTSAVLTRDALIPRSPDGTGRGLMLALGVHALLLVAIAFSVSWRTSDPAGVEAELWAAVPQIAAPRPAEPEPTPLPKKVDPPPPPKVEPTPKVPDAQIAIEKAKREEEKRKEEAKREELQRQKEEAQRKQDEAEQKKKELAEKKKREAAETAAAEKRREDQIARMAALAGDGAPNSPGTAARTAGPSATYAGRIKARILPNIVFSDTITGNPLATVEVKAAPDGTIIGKRLLKSSGVPAWDEAVLRAIDKTEILPRDTDGRVPSSFEINFRPRE
jgi:colicin import membrane protein